MIGKIDLLCPNLYDSKYSDASVHGDQLCNFFVNQQVRLVPQYKKVGTNDSDMIRDGFSVLIDQLRLDFDYKFYGKLSHAPTQQHPP